MYTVFLMDDEPIILDMLAHNPLFLECGYQIIGKSSTPQAAVEEILHLQPDVVFTDLRMPGLSGIELMESLKKREFYCEFVLFSAFGEFQDVRTFFKNSGFDYLLKPVSEHDLANVLVKLALRLAAKESAPKQVTQTGSPELNRILLYLNDNLSQKHTLDSLSNRFGLNPNYICNLFARHLDTTFVSYITTIRMWQAARLLKQSEKPVKEIAVLCGYRDYFYFCRVFRDFYHQTPSGFREDEAQ